MYILFIFFFFLPSVVFSKMSYLDCDKQKLDKYMCDYMKKYDISYKNLDHYYNSRRKLKEAPLGEIEECVFNITKRTGILRKSNNMWKKFKHRKKKNCK